MAELDVVVVGAGQAGLGVSYCLQQNGRQHIVFERGQIGETWRTQRWDSFRLNTPNFMNALPGLAYDGPEPDGFWSRDEYVRYLQRYDDRWQLPIQTSTAVVSVEQTPGKEGFVVRTKSDGQREESVTSRSVVIASGMLQAPKVPAFRDRLPHSITQLHTADYRNPEALPPGAVLVVGGGQSGVQIAEDLLSAGRTVYLCSSRVGRVPRRYRGRDILEWWIDMRFLDVPYDSLEDKSISRAPQPQASGIGRYGHTVSLQHLAREGVVILGRLLDVDGGTVVLGDDAADNVRFADEFSQRQKDGIDAYLKKAGIAMPPLEDDPADVPDTEAVCASPLSRLDLGRAKISSVVWATGFTADFRWIHLPVLGSEAQPLYQQGVAPARGLYFAGFPWLRTRKSGIIYGIDEDVHYITDAIEEQLS